MAESLDSLRSLADSQEFSCTAWAHSADPIMVFSAEEITYSLDCSIPLPLLVEQRRIVEKVDELMALVDKLEVQLAAFRATGEKLLAALVAGLTA